MKKFVSISKYPGSTGKYFYSKFFDYYGIDAVYEPIGTDNLEKTLRILRDENNVMAPAGISVSMPYKHEIIEYLDRQTAYVETYNSCNTVKVVDGQLIGYNADIAGVEWACTHIKPGDRITILGAGAMASMFALYLESSHDVALKLAARSLDTWDLRNDAADVIINCTGLGTSTDASPFARLPSDVRLVIDLAIPDNQLKKQTLAAGVKYLSGQEFYKKQFVKQFEIYTGIRLDEKIYDEFSQQRNEKI